MPFAVPPADLPQVRPSVTVAEAAQMLSVDAGTIRRLVRKGEIEGHGIGVRGVRVFADSLAMYQRRRTLATATPEEKPRQHSASHRAAMAALRAAGIL